MKNLQKHPVTAGQYIGKAGGGTWKVKRCGTGKTRYWRGIKVSGEKFVCDPPAITGKTLEEISKALTDLDIQVAAEVAAHDAAVAAVAVEMAGAKIADYERQLEAVAAEITRDDKLPNPFKWEA